MRISKKYFVVAISTLVMNLTAGAQNTTSTNVYSPFTMYGIGQLSSQASLGSRLMGGVGIANNFASEWRGTMGGVVGADEMNFLNPASLGYIRQRSALFSFGAEGQNYYAKAQSVDAYGKSYSSSSVNNNFTLQSIGFAIPLAKGVGFGVALTPVSTIGYNTSYVNNSPDIINNVGRVLYSYTGDGGISSVSASVGVKVAKGLSLGASLLYYFGSLDRYYNADVLPMLNPSAYYGVVSYEKTSVSRLLGMFGARYSFRVSKYGYLAVGATFQTRAAMNNNHKELTMITRSNSADTVKFFDGKRQMIMPAKFGGGIFYQSRTVGFGVDYTFQDWRGSFDTDPAQTGVTLAAQQEIRLGVSITPKAEDIRHALNRWTYRVGAQYTANYVVMDGKQLSSASLTFGVEVPLRFRSLSKLVVGLEYGQQGTFNDSKVKDQFWRVFLGFNFYGDDGWFAKRKFE